MSHVECHHRCFTQPLQPLRTLGGCEEGFDLIGVYSD